MYQKESYEVKFVAPDDLRAGVERLKEYFDYCISPQNDLKRAYERVREVQVEKKRLRVSHEGMTRLLELCGGVHGNLGQRAAGLFVCARERSELLSEQASKADQSRGIESMFVEEEDD